MQILHIETALTFNSVKAAKINYLLNTSFKALAGKNLTFWDAAI